MDKAQVGQFAKDLLQGGLKHALGLDQEGTEAQSAEVLTLPGMMAQLQHSVNTATDSDETARLALLVACIIMRQQGWTDAAAFKQAMTAWGQTAALRKR